MWGKENYLFFFILCLFLNEPALTVEHLSFHKNPVLQECVENKEVDYVKLEQETWKEN